MAEDMIELGIEGIDKLVDKHFHKVPDKLVDKHTYHPHCRARRSGERRRDEEGESSASGDDVAYDPRPRESYQHQRMSRPSNASGYGHEYSAPDGYGYGYSPTSPNRLGPDPQDSRGMRRREGLVRRSSSQPGGVRERERDREKGGEKRRRRRRSLSNDRERYTAKTGSGGGNGPGKTESVVLTLLGIAAGGLAGVAASGVIGAMERKRDGRDRGENMKEDEKGRSSGGRRVQPAERQRTKGGGRR
ncbi:hypothetical protein BGZ57DRAFT_186160 [Hyaloscypha finlandica]|nr:hypothetical protein BGZ57DRAFT_186160 [Hyaloscypha finlandica]